MQHIHCLAKLSCSRCVDRSIFHQARHYIAPVRQDRPLDSSMVQHSLPNRTDFDGAPGVHIPFAVLLLFAGARVFPPERPHLPFRVPRLDRFRRGIGRPTITPTFAGGRSRGVAAAPGENPRAVRSCRSCDVTTGRCCHGLCLLQVFGDLVGPARFRSAHPPAEQDFNAMFRATCSAIQRTTGDRVISLRKPLPAPIRSWVYGDFRNECDFRRHLFPSVRCLPHRTHRRPCSVLRG
jgi:hypothetical protein